MSRNLSKEGKGLDEEPSGLPGGDNTSLRGKAKKAPSRPATPQQRRTNQAIDDAQSSLDSLLKTHSNVDTSARSDNEPQIISPSGFVRNQTTGRIAGPASPTEGRKTVGITGPSYYLGAGPDDEDDDEFAGVTIIDGNADAASSNDRTLAVVPGTVPLYPSDQPRQVPNSAIERGLTLATNKIQVAKDRAGLLVSAVDMPNGLGVATDDEALHTSHHRASRLATRYATYIVAALVVVGLLVFGASKIFTPPAAYSHNIESAQALGTDHVSDDDSSYLAPGQQSSDDTNYTLTLPRTQLSGTDPSGTPGASTKPVDPKAYQAAPYTVVDGDTVTSLAQKFNIMPETVMGSNGIWDSEEILAPGRVLMIPPIDGMYYVPKQGDTLQSVADRFQVVPTSISAYPGNALQNGQPVAGQALIVPAGMMPQRADIVTYTVRDGDTVKKIAARYGIDVPTVAYANNMGDADNIAIGEQLKLLPIPGVQYTIQKGDTVTSIADKLDTTPQMILDYPPNNLTADSALQTGQVIMVPGGTPADVVAQERRQEAAANNPQPQQQAGSSSSSNSSGSSSNSSSDLNSNDTGSGSGDSGSSKPAPTAKPKPTAKPQKSSGSSSGSTSQSGSSGSKSSSSGSSNSPKAGTDSFMWPVVSPVITQYFSAAHNGLDLAVPAGTPIHAADSGKVMWAGWRTDGLGYCVIIDHLDGYSTVYGHMIRQPSVSVGQYVSQGQVIGYVGSTGHSTGPHVHFMIKSGSSISHYYLNPLKYLSR